ncbi:cathepsin F-like [Heterodontus francisci]|uniref:cathepsin F-like n=1 Tax=Heterodontus francisci TaxID=7792 RepID=UPI00355C2828
MREPPGPPRTMFRLAVIGLAFTCGLLQSEATPQGDDLETEDADRLLSQFKEFKVTYNKHYDKVEEEKRFRIFAENLQKAKKMQDQDRGSAEYGITKFSDMSDEEFDAFYLNPEISENNSTWPMEAYLSAETKRLENLTAPCSFDWRQRGAVTYVRNQKRCGSCWAFATIANIESMWYIRRKKLIVLSEQELLDCDSWDRACKGGYPYTAFNAIISLGGVMRQVDYRYKALKGSCTFRRSRAVVKITTYHNIRSHEVEMKAWVAQKGPIIIQMNAAAMKGYKRGIARPFSCYCSPWKLNHVVLIVGYGVSRGLPYWIIKNSWGANWGEKGYFRIYRGENSCGLNRFPCSSFVG